MTAPDVNDVRARFEAWMAKQGASIHRDGPFYTSTYTQGAWSGYRAALFGEVRELVEADREYDGALRGLVPAFHTTVERLNKAMERRDRALAKFTQEKP